MMFYLTFLTRSEISELRAVPGGIAAIEQIEVLKMSKSETNTRKRGELGDGEIGGERR